MVVRREVAGETTRYVERMAPRSAGFFVDAGVRYSGDPHVSFSDGLSHLEGKTVSVLADGAVLSRTSIVKILQDNGYGHLVFGTAAGGGVSADRVTVAQTMPGLRPPRRVSVASLASAAKAGAGALTVRCSRRGRSSAATA